MEKKYFDLNDIVEMKKFYFCGINWFKIICMGMDIWIKCEGCGYSVMIFCCEFEWKVKKILVKVE